MGAPPWTEVAARHLCAPAAGAAGVSAWAGQPIEPVELSGATLAAERAWLRGEAAGGRFCAAFVAPGEGEGVRRWRVRATLTLDIVHGGGEGGGCAADVHARVMLPLLHAGCRMLDDGAMAAHVTAPRALHVTYVPRPEKRALPLTRGEPLAAEHVNGGLTDHGGGGTTRVLVWRAEDGCKVLLHEVLHAYGVDGRLHDRAVDIALARDLGVTTTDGGGVRLAEAYVDAVACYLYAMWQVGTARGQALTRALTATREHMEVGAARVMLHYRGGAWHERTNACAYYVIKAALWADLPALLRAAPESSAVDALLRRDRSRPSYTFATPGRLPARAWREASASRSLRMTPPARVHEGLELGGP